jgi:hypothetical protein
MARSEPQMASGGPVYVPVPVVIDGTPTAPPQPAAIQPIIVTGAGGGTTIATQVGGTTVVSEVGGGRSGWTTATQVGDTTVVSRFGGAGSGTTMATQVGDTTVVSQIRRQQRALLAARPADLHRQPDADRLHHAGLAAVALSAAASIAL